MKSRKSKLGAIGACAALAALALAVSCRGFFVNPTVQSISLQPQTPSLAVGNSIQMQAWATDSDGNKYELTSNVAWTLSGVTATNGGTVMTLSPSGYLTATSVGSGTINASSEGVSASTTATVVELTDSMTITPPDPSVSDTGSNFATYTVTDQYGNNISALVTLTAYSSPPPNLGTAVTQITCAYDSTDSGQDCTPGSGLVTSGSTVYYIVVTYSGYTGSSTVYAQLTVDAP